MEPVDRGYGGDGRWGRGCGQGLDSAGWDGEGGDRVGDKDRMIRKGQGGTGVGDG